MPEPKTYVTADLHMEHPAILEYNPITRPFASMNEMHDFIVEEWNATVTRNDFVIIVGDLAYRNYDKWAQKLKGKKFLVLGNHDAINQQARCHFVKVCDCLLKTINGKQCFFFHYPCLTWANKEHGSYMIHGHSHGRLPEDGFSRRVDVSMDVWGMRVVPIEVIFKKLSMRRKFEMVDDRDVEEVNKRVVASLAENMKLLNEYNDSIKKKPIEGVTPPIMV